MNPSSPPRAPVFAETGFLIVEGGLGACAMAGRLATVGRPVTLVCSGTSPGREFATRLRAWMSDDEINRLPPDLTRIMSPALGECVGGVHLIDLTTLTTALEDWLLDCGVRLFYAQTPAGILRQPEGPVRGALFAGKAGLFAMAAETVVDATDTATLVQIATGVRNLSCVEPPVFSWITQADGVPLDFQSAEPLAGTRVSRFGPWLEWQVSLSMASDAPLEPGAVALRMRQTVAAALPVLRKMPGCQTLSLVRGADAIGLPGWHAPAIQDLPDGLFLFHPAMEQDSLRFDSDGPSALWKAGLEMAGSLADNSTPQRLLREEFDDVLASTAPPGSPCVLQDTISWGLTDPAEPLGLLGSVPWEGTVAAVETCRILVVGAGTSGVPAAIEAARADPSSTVLLEKHADVGGTHTVGGVPDYWYGRKTPYLKRHDEHLRSLRKTAGLPVAFGKLDLLLRHGVRPCFHQTLAGVAFSDRNLHGVLAAGPQGLTLFRARNFIDATGDGDLAAWTGHPHTYGAESDDATLWYSCGKFRMDREAACREYQSVVDLRNPADTSRAVITSRRRDGLFGRGEIPQFYLAPRENRHILGRTTVTYEDILSGARPSDTAFVCKANFDIKGTASDPLTLAGFVEPDFHRNFECRVPWRALLPRDLDNLIIAGKAYSITHDAFALARMQRDLIAMGAVAGKAVSLAGTDPVGTLDFALLRPWLLEAGILLPGDAEPPPSPPSSDSLLGLLDKEQLELCGCIHLLRRAPEVAEDLRQRFNGRNATTSAPLLAARILYQATGDPEAGRSLLRALDEALAGEELPELHTDKARHACPDHGWAPWPCYLIHALAQKREANLSTRLQALSARLPRELTTSDKHFHYVFALALAAGHLATPDLRPTLETTADLPWLRDAVLPPDADPRQTVDPTRERFAYLALLLARAARQCGDPRAGDRLRDFTRDPRRWLARSALQALARCHDLAPDSASHG